MKKTLLFFAIFSSMMIFAQTCGYTAVQNELESRNPQVKANREAAEAKLLQTDVRSYLNVIAQCKKPTRKWHIWFFPTHEPTLKNQKSHFFSNA